VETAFATNRSNGGARILLCKIEICQDHEANNLYSEKSVAFNGQKCECHSSGEFFTLA